MSGDCDLPKSPSTETLRRALEASIDGACLPIRLISRTPWPYTSSFAIEELAIQLRDGQTQSILFKDLSPASMLPGARNIKRAFGFNPCREIEVYRALLTPMGVSSPKFIGSIVEENAQRFWLFLERIDGIPLWQIGDFESWRDVVRWLAAFHHSFSNSWVDLTARAPLLVRCDEEWLRSRLSDKKVAALHRIDRSVDNILQLIQTVPTTFIHGEFYASNIMIDRSGELPVRPVDWEMPGVGPGLLDLAALTAGSWTDSQRFDLLETYLKAGGPGGDNALKAFDACRLVIALQWLGRSDDWSPPPEHRTNWLAEAGDAANRLGLS